MWRAIAEYCWGGFFLLVALAACRYGEKRAALIWLFLPVLLAFLFGTFFLISELTKG